METVIKYTASTGAIAGAISDMTEEMTIVSSWQPEICG